MVRVPRFNLAGFCQVCLVHGCTNPVCVAKWDRLRWEVCVHCGGSGYEDYPQYGPERACVLCDACTGEGIEVVPVDPVPLAVAFGWGRP